MNISECAKECHRIAVEHGWWDEATNVPEKLCLVHSEVSEAVESYRLHYPQSHFAEELADIVIRVFDLSVALDVDIEKAILEKMERNEQRSYRHGGKKC